jgi:enoyl-CoA hydratase/carnithine racemase
MHNSLPACWRMQRSCARGFPAAERFAERVCNASPLAVQAAVRLYNLCSEFSPDMSALARHLDQETAESEDGARRAARFKEKRKPQWKLRRRTRSGWSGKMAA